MSGLPVWMLVPLALAGVPAAQVPVDHGVRGTFGLPGPDDIVDVANQRVAPIVGLSPAGGEINAMGLDPVTGALLLGGITASISAGELRSVRLNGSTVASEQILARVTNTDSLKALDLDRNGNVFMCNGATIFRIVRGTNLVTTWDSSAQYQGGTFNALCIDADYDRMWAATYDVSGGALLIEYDLGRGPGSGRVTDLRATCNVPGTVSGLDDDGCRGLYLTTFDTGGRSVVHYDTVARVLTGDTGVPRAGVNAVHFNRKDGSIHLVGAGLHGDYWVMDKFGSNQPARIITPQANVGTPSSVVVNDLGGRTEVFPRTVIATNGFTLEMAAHGNPNDFGIVTISRINHVPYLLPLAVGFCDGGGFFTAPAAWIPGGILAKGTTLSYLSATIDPATLVLQLGSEMTQQFR